MPRAPAIFAMTLAALPLSAAAQEVGDVLAVTIRDGWVTESGTRMIGIQIALAPGWHTYWRQPGDAGIPPELNLAGSQNLVAAAIHWPVPESYDQNGYATLIYRDGVVLPVELTPASDGPIALAGSLTLGVCQEICIPAEVGIDRVLSGPGRADPAISAALADAPADAAALGIERAVCDAEAIADGLKVTFDLPEAAARQAPFAVVETSDPTVWVSGADARTEAGRYLVSAELVPAEAQPFLLDRSDLRLTLIGQDGAVEYSGCLARS